MPRLPTGPFSTHRTGCYGCVRRSPSDGSCGVHTYPCVHRGIDMFATSSDVFAPEAGVVERVADGSSPPFTGYGPGVILIRGASGFYHLLSHLDFKSIAVRPGQLVADGQRIARFDNEIKHTHYEVRRAATGSSETNNVDPNQWLAEQQRFVAAITEAASKPSPGKKVAIGVAVATGFVGLSWLALHAAKRLATAT